MVGVRDCVRVAPLVLAVAVGCSTAPAPVHPGFDLGAASLDSHHPEVVWLSSECSGTLVGPRSVLTAAHCVVDIDRMPAVRIVAARTETLFAVRCRVHPRAFPDAGE